MKIVFNFGVTRVLFKKKQNLRDKQCFSTVGCGAGCGGKTFWLIPGSFGNTENVIKTPIPDKIQEICFFFLFENIF